MSYMANLLQIAHGPDPVGEVTQFVFFKTINDFLRKEIDIFQWNLLQSTTLFIGGVALIFMTLWVLFKGYRIVTGQSRDPMMALVSDSLRALLIVSLATSMAAGSSALFWTLSDGTSSAITNLISGNDNPFQAIDSNLAAMQGALILIDAIDTGGNKEAEDTKARDKWFTGIGIAGPGVIAGSMLLLNKIAVALFIGFGPLFIMALLHPATKSLFSRWLLYGIGTVFSLAVLSVMTDIAMRMVEAVSFAFIAGYLSPMGGGSTEGINSMALQQGGLGLVLSTLIVMAPPMAASFFQGVLGHFASYSSFGSIGAHGAMGRAQRNLSMGLPPTALPPANRTAIPQHHGNLAANVASAAGGPHDRIRRHEPTY